MHLQKLKIISRNIYTRKMPPWLFFFIFHIFFSISLCLFVFVLCHSASALCVLHDVALLRAFLCAPCIIPSSSFVVLCHTSLHCIVSLNLTLLADFIPPPFYQTTKNNLSPCADSYLRGGEKDREESKKRGDNAASNLGDGWSYSDGGGGALCNWPH